MQRCLCVPPKAVSCSGKGWKVLCLFLLEFYAFADKTLCLNLLLLSWWFLRQRFFQTCCVPSSIAFMKGFLVACQKHHKSICIFSCVVLVLVYCSVCSPADTQGPPQATSNPIDQRRTYACAFLCLNLQWQGGYSSVTPAFLLEMTTTSKNITRSAQEWMIFAFVYGLDARKRSLWMKMLPVTNKAAGFHRWSPTTSITSVLRDVKVVILWC